jgi:multidrug efflux pump subunit AcrB
VKKAEVWAFPEQQVQVLADLEKMPEPGITLDSLLTSLESAAANIPGG